mmetsp:Transcript_1958/g.4830  ORF Transcript_1958/g.4830 Transcript_1958/m.4830 type:complete len:215 (-) Transcript_1958:322-966(-)
MRQCSNELLLLLLWLLLLLLLRLLTTATGHETHQTGSHHVHGSLLRALLHHLFEFGLLVRAALVVTVHVRTRHTNGHEVDDEPRKFQTEDLDDRQHAPDDRGRVKDSPKDILVELVVCSVLRAFEDPLRSLAFHLVPPAKADKETAGHILHGPKVECQQEDADDDDGHEIASGLVLVHQLVTHQVDDESQALEEDVEEAHEGVRRLTEVTHDAR